ncbi:MAG: KOW motif-containing protein [Bdellovibrionales bacterium]|nr:KOW motif-containing protein [Bdellovibrionales bacterium]
MKLKVKKGTLVQVIAGADKGKKGTVIEVNPKTLRVKVQGIRVHTRHDKKDGLKKAEGFIDYSNVKMLEAAPQKTEKKTAKKTKTAKSN